MTAPFLSPDDSRYREKFDSAIDALVAHRYCVIDDFFETALISQLHAELVGHVEGDALQQARVGQGEQQQRVEAIRGDAIRWLGGETPAQAQFLALMEQYRTLLNRQLFLGLVELEAHFAHYPPGSGYVTHLDSFQNNNQRRITVVAYLNPQWGEADGGQMEIMQDDEVVCSVPPLAGTLVTFVSEEVPHRVVATQRDRYSIAGWFRVRDPDLVR